MNNNRLLRLAELELHKIMQSKIIHFGSATAMLEDSSQEMYFQVMQLAKEKNILISFDPNYREFLWKGNIEKFPQGQGTLLWMQPCFSYPN